jgi:hypothetical protein
MGFVHKAQSYAIMAARFEVPLAICVAISTAAIFGAGLFASPGGRAAELSAGAARVDITNRDAGPDNDPLYAKALVLKDESTTMVIVTVDAVAIAGIGSIKNEYLANVRAQLQRDPGIPPEHVLINASHCHGVVCADVEQRTVQAVREAWKKVVPVTVGAGRGREDRVSQNRRLKLKNGKEADVRHAYSLPPDEEVAGVGPIDPEIGILRIDRKTGGPLAVVYNFACHPIQGVPSRGNTADITGFASQAIEDSLGEGTTALFLQGCAGDINPAFYKDVDRPRDAEPLGNRLALSTLKAATKIRTRDGGVLKVIHEKLELPRADLAPRIDDLVAEQARLLKSLKGTSLSLKTFLPLAVKYKLSEFPSYDSHGYLHEKLIGRDDLEKLDAGNRENLMQYIRNIHTMEELTRVQTNLDLLRMHHAQNVAAGKRTIDVEVLGVRIADFVFVTFPGEPTVEIGLKIKKNPRHEFTFVAGYTNGYIYYAPTAEQLQNVGNAQEDSDCLLAPEWQALFEAKVAEILKRI